MNEGEEPPLKLAVLDAEDLAVVSAHLQDAEASVAEMAHLPRQGRFALVVARFDWPLAAKGRLERCRTGLHFERVLHVARQGLPDGGPTLSLLLLAITFTPVDAPAGTVLLTFQGGEQIRLTVECLEAEMRDIGPRWAVDAKPTLADGATSARPPDGRAAPRRP